MASKQETEMPYAHSMTDFFAKHDWPLGSDDILTSEIRAQMANDFILILTEQLRLKATDRGEQIPTRASLHLVLAGIAQSTSDNFVADRRSRVGLELLFEKQTISEAEARALVTASLNTAIIKDSLFIELAKLRGDEAVISMSTPHLDKKRQKLEFLNERAAPPAFPGAAGA